MDMRYKHSVIDTAKHLAAVAAGTTQATERDFDLYLWLNWRTSAGWKPNSVSNPNLVTNTMRYENAVQALAVYACAAFYERYRQEEEKV